MVIESLNVDEPPTHLAHHMRASSEPTARAVSDAGGDEGAGGGNEEGSEITNAFRRYYESDAGGDGDGGGGGDGDGDGDGDGEGDAASEGGVGVVAGVEESTVDKVGRVREEGEVGGDTTINGGDAGDGDGRDSEGALVEYD